MVAIQLRVSTDDGVDRLRAYSCACGRPISAVAADIIARRLTLQDQPNSPTGDTGPFLHRRPPPCGGCWFAAAPLNSATMLTALGRVCGRTGGDLLVEDARSGSDAGDLPAALARPRDVSSRPRAARSPETAPGTYTAHKAG